MSLVSGPIGNWASGEALSCDGSVGATDQSAGKEKTLRYGNVLGVGLLMRSGLVGWKAGGGTQGRHTGGVRSIKDETEICHYAVERRRQKGLKMLQTSGHILTVIWRSMRKATPSWMQMAIQKSIMPCHSQEVWSGHRLNSTTSAGTLSPVQDKRTFSPISKGEGQVQKPNCDKFERGV